MARSDSEDDRTSAADGHVRHWREGSFGPASEEPYRRRTSDWIRLSVAVALLAFAAVHEGSTSASENLLFQFFNTLPDQLRSLFLGLDAIGAIWAVAIVVLAALVAKRWRLARDLAIAGVGAWVLARFLGAIVVESASVSQGIDVVTRFGKESPSFPSVRLAVVVAVVATAAPYLTRPMRRLGQLLILLLALTALYLGTGLPNQVFAGVVLGWGVAALIHLVFGSPGGRPSRRQVGATLAELGVPVDDVQLVPTGIGEGTRMTARDTTGRIDIRVLGRDEADAQFLAKAWRFLVYKDSARLHLTRLEDVEQEANAALLAERALVPGPSVVVSGAAGPGTALIATRPVTGTGLHALPVDRIDDALLATVWRLLTELHHAGVAHGRANAVHVIVMDDGRAAWRDYTEAIGAATKRQRHADIAELLVATALLVGDDRAISAARAACGDEELVAALPLVQLPALSAEVRPPRRKARKALGKHLDTLREAAATAAGTEAPPLQPLYRVNTTSLLMAIGSLIAIGALLSQVGDPETFYETIKDADWWYLFAALLVSFATNCATAVSLMGCVPIPLPLWRTSELQLSMSFSNLAVPAIGGMAAQIRFLQKQGVDLASAVASGGLLANAGNIAAQCLLFGVAILLSPTTIDMGKVDVSELVSIVTWLIVAIVIAASLVFGIPKFRHFVIDRVRQPVLTMWEALRSPKRLAFLFGGNIVNAMMYAFCLQLCLLAFGGDLDYWTILTLNIFISTIASLVPIPGGGTAVSSVGMSGALAAAGVPTEIAVAAVLANQLVANFIPAVPGWVATKDLLDHGYL